MYFIQIRFIVVSHVIYIYNTIYMFSPLKLFARSTHWIIWLRK